MITIESVNLILQQYDLVCRDMDENDKPSIESLIKKVCLQGQHWHLSNDENSYTLVVVDRINSVIAFVHGNPTNVKNKFELGLIIVDPDFQHLGIGRSLVCLLLNYYKAQGFNNVIAEVGANDRMKIFLWLTKLGFQLTDKTDFRSPLIRNLDDLDFISSDTLRDTLLRRKLPDDELVSSALYCR